MAEEQRAARFDLNEGADKSNLLLPNPPDTAGVIARDAASAIEVYERLFAETLQPENGFFAALNALVGKDFKVADDSIIKALNLPPTAFNYARINIMPDPAGFGVIPWPGIAPEALAKIARENVAPQLIIGMRVDDVLRYSKFSDQPWKPGWR